MEELNPSCMARSNRKTKEEYINDLQGVVYELLNKLTVKEIRTLIAKYARS